MSARGLRSFSCLAGVLLSLSWGETARAQSSRQTLLPNARVRVQLPADNLDWYVHAVAGTPHTDALRLSHRGLTSMNIEVSLVTDQSMGGCRELLEVTTRTSRTRGTVRAVYVPITFHPVMQRRTNGTHVSDVTCFETPDGPVLTVVNYDTIEFGHYELSQITDTLRAIQDGFTHTTHATTPATVPVAPLTLTTGSSDGAIDVTGHTAQPTLVGAGTDVPAPFGTSSHTTLGGPDLSSVPPGHEHSHVDALGTGEPPTIPPPLSSTTESGRRPGARDATFFHLGTEMSVMSRAGSGEVNATWLGLSLGVLRAFRTGPLAHSVEASGWASVGWHQVTQIGNRANLAHIGLALDWHIGGVINRNDGLYAGLGFTAQTGIVDTVSVGVGMSWLHAPRSGPFAFHLRLRALNLGMAAGMGGVFAMTPSSIEMRAFVGGFFVGVEGQFDPFGVSSSAVSVPTAGAAAILRLGWAPRLR